MKWKGMEESMWRACAVVVAGFLFAPFPAIADAQDLSTATEDFFEDVDPVWPVSGHVVVGAMGYQQSEPEPSLLLFFGPRADVTICVEIMSRSRNYRARFTVTQADLETELGYVNVLEMSRHRDVLSELAGPDLAVRATQNACRADQDEAAALFIAGWGRHENFIGASEAELPATVRLLVNARTSAAAVVITDGNELLHEAACEHEVDPRRSGFDFVCTISLEEATKRGLSEIDGFVYRSDFGRPQEPAPFQLLLFGE